MVYTNLAYNEFDSTVGTLIKDIGDKVAASASWSKVSPTTSLGTLSVATVAGATTLTFAAGVVAAAGFFVGQVIRIDDYGSGQEYRTITASTATTLTVTALRNAHAIGCNVYNGNEVYKATTTDGVDMIVDLAFAGYDVSGTNGLSLAAYSAYSGSGLGTATNPITRWLWWKGAVNTAATPVHCVVSASKDHLFISVEGPRESEANPDSVTLGSCRNYFWMDSVVRYYGSPYDVTPTVAVGGQMVNSAAASNVLSMYCHQLKSPLGNFTWEQSKIATLANPDNGLALSQHVQHFTPDGNFDLFPYAVFGDFTGRRGRLHSFWFAGFMNPDLLDTICPMPPVGSKQVLGGDTYKLLPMNKTGTNIACWSQFGGLTNNNNSVNNIVVAVPCA